MKRRLVIAVMCVPIPPLFLDFPLRQMMLPFIGRLPVNSQILAITFLSKFGVENSICPTTCKHFQRVPFGTKVRDFLEPGRSVENVQSMVWNKVSGRAECEMGVRGDTQKPKLRQRTQ